MLHNTQTACTPHLLVEGLKKFKDKDYFPMLIVHVGSMSDMVVAVTMEVVLMWSASFVFKEERIKTF